MNLASPFLFFVAVDIQVPGLLKDGSLIDGTLFVHFAHSEAADLRELTLSVAAVVIAAVIVEITVGGLITVVLVVLQLDLVALSVQNADIQAEGLQFLDQNLEGLGHAGLRHIVAP